MLGELSWSEARELACNNGSAVMLPDGRLVPVAANRRSIDARTADGFRRTIMAAARPGGHIAVDMGAVEVLDSEGLGALIAASAAVREQGSELSLYNVRPDISNLLSMVCLDKLIEVRDAEPGWDAYCPRQSGREVLA